MGQAATATRQPTAWSPPAARSPATSGATSSPRAATRSTPPSRSGFALDVVHPEAGNIGGGGFMVFRPPDGKVYALDYRETAPAAATRNMYLDSRGHLTDQSINGALARGRPGLGGGAARGAPPVRQAAAGARHRAGDRAGARRLRRRLVPRARHCVARAIAFARYSAGGARPTIWSTARRPRPGTRLVQPDLAHTLEPIRDHGRDGFYKGWVAQAIVAEMRSDGGIITATDLAGLSRQVARNRSPSTTAATPSTRCRRRRPAAPRWRDPQHHGGLRAAAALRLDRAAAPRGRGDAAGLHRPQRLPRRPRLREDAAR